MRSYYFLGQFIAPVSPSLPSSYADHHPQVGFLQRGHQELHVYCAPRQKIGRLSSLASEHLGPLLGQISLCLTPVTSNKVSSSNPEIMKVRAFVVSRRGVPPELRGCVFSRAKDIHRVQMAFRASNIDLTPIWNYNPSAFFDIPQVEFVRTEAHEVTAQQPWVTRALCQFRTALKPHQLTALLFLRNNETANADPMVLWNHPTNAWIRSCVDQTGFNPLGDSTSPRAQGSILADNMGLGKTLTALAFILSTFDSAVQFMWEKGLKIPSIGHHKWNPQLN
ncbi:hypothetical protein PTTG_25286 [Puccinia triticina 1-1 BBBD Race 1]|uniref:SNF2_N domain-containing protein n=1 Tax=Puccinia triticina (isolate 1-1 / race 1 (BBBD)) TaxID=630390 RepID=A0A180H5A2_PUCT1|nr:hypothetical protein PTTG_25286 [Puccinia triticina 1-1 BBBD Race 1]